MEIVNPSDLDTVRSYFTGLDLRLVIRSGDVGTRELTRRLKLLSVLKGHIVIAASHLVESMSEYPFLRDNPELLSNGVIIPALRNEFTTVTDFVTYTDPKRKTSWVGVAPVEEAAKVIDSTARFAVQWNVDDASAFFASLMTDHLQSSASLLRSMLPDVSQLLADQIVQRLQSSERLSRDDISNSLSMIPSDISRERFRRYADLAYYISGARAVNSVGILPQENLGRLDYGSSLDHTNLSELDIFFSHCANAIFAASGPRILPEDLDKLEVEDILALRDGWIGPRFREKYNRIITLCREGIQIRDPHDVVLRLDELETLAREITIAYRKAAQSERLIKVSMDTGMSLLSLVLSGVLDTTDYAVTGLQVIGDWIDTDSNMKGKLGRVKEHIQVVRGYTGDILSINQELTRFLENFTEKVLARTT